MRLTDICKIILRELMTNHTCFKFITLWHLQKLAYALRSQVSNIWTDSQMGATVPKHLFLFSLMRLLAANSRGRAGAAACH